MPLYDYECLACSNIFELRQSFTDDPVGTCPKCQGHSRRKFVAVPIIYKGSGFYTTDYARSGAKSTGTGADSSEKKTENTKEEASKSTTSAKKEDSGSSSSNTSKKES